MEAATADLDVRPGFVGDVMAGGRRRHTRRLVALTAAVALLAGVTTGVVLTDSSPEPVVAADARLTATTAVISPATGRSSARCKRCGAVRRARAFDRTRT